MAFPRRIEPEWLDSLPNMDPDAAASRRDLRRLNLLMRHAIVLARILSTEFTSAKLRSLLDIGGGDGTFMLAVVRKLAKGMPAGTLTMVDKNTGISDETHEHFSALGWNVLSVKADVMDYLDTADAAGMDAVIANLFLHHFSDIALARLLRGAARAARFAGNKERCRAWFPMAASRLLWAIGCNHVTQHDAPASVRAGFRGKELSSLWPAVRGWQIDERRAGPFSHCFAARHVA
jgi:hypothetical protein